MKGTIESSPPPAWAIDLIEVEVIDGPDTGKKALARSERLTMGAALDNDLVLGDPTASRYHVELERVASGIRVRDTHSTNGTYWAGRTGSETVRLYEAVITANGCLLVGANTIVVRDGGRRELPMHGEATLCGLIGQSSLMRRLMARVTRAADTDASILLQGESGTGKELAARAIHDLGPRTGRPFVTVDCGALSPNLIASELFGHEKGAFTGADKRHIGAFEQASGGTLFLDEIGELPPSLQPALLGALERRRFKRVGGQDEIATDVRVISATNRDLRQEINAGDFRLDLYYRVAVVTIRIPALRERSEDVIPLAAHFLRELGDERTASDVFDAETLRRFASYGWPGNVRELRNMVEATVAMGEIPDGDLLFADADDRDPDDRDSDDRASGDAPGFSRYFGQRYRDARSSVLDAFEAAYVQHFLEKAEGNVAKAARAARMDRSTLFDLIKKHGLR